jgi:hypothetical protein
MEKRRRVVLFGNSIILGTVGEKLRRLSGYEVMTLLPSQTDELKKIAPDVVLFDLETGHSKEMFSLPDGYSKELFVGVSPDRNIVKMWSGQRLQELSTSDLLQAIEQQLNHKEVLRGKTQNRKFTF